MLKMFFNSLFSGRPIATSKIVDYQAAIYMIYISIRLRSSKMLRTYLEREGKN